MEAMPRDHNQNFNPHQNGFPVLGSHRSPLAARYKQATAGRMTNLEVAQSYTVVAVGAKHWNDQSVHPYDILMRRDDGIGQNEESSWVQTDCNCF